MATEPGAHRAISDAIYVNHWPFDDYFGKCPCGWGTQDPGYITDHLADVALQALEAAGYPLPPYQPEADEKGYL